MAVDIYPPNASLIANSDPKDQLQAKFSAPFAIGLVLTGHDPEDVRLPMEWLVDPKVRGWYPSITVRADNAVPRRHARVTVAWRDGAEESADQPFRNLDEKKCGAVSRPPRAATSAKARARWKTRSPAALRSRTRPGWPRPFGKIGV